MRKRRKFKAVVFMKSAAFVMALCMMIGSLGIPVSAEEKNSNLQDSPENTVSDALTKSGPEAGTEKTGSEAAAANNAEEKSPKKDGSEGKTGNLTDGIDPGKDGSEGKTGNPTDGADPGKDGSEGKTSNPTDAADPEKEGSEEKEPDGGGEDGSKEEPGGEGNEAAADDGTGEQKPEGTQTENSVVQDKKDTIQDTVSGNDSKKEETEKLEIEEIEKETKKKTEEKETNVEKWEMPKIIDVVVPTTYTLALNPYGLPVNVGENYVSTEQIISGTYGIVNKSSSDQVVTVSVMIEDHTEGELLFVDSAEEAQNAGKDVYAVYLAAVPANEEPVLIDGRPVDCDVSGESLQSVGMTGAQDQAVALYAGINQIAFRLSGAVYHSESEEEPETEENLPEGDSENSAGLMEENPEDDISLSENLSEDPSEDTGDLTDDIPEGEQESTEKQPDVPEDDILEEEDISTENDISEEEDISAEDSTDQISEEESEEVQVPEFVLRSLEPNGKGVTAYTFYGVMNPDAEWEKLQGGIRLSVVYTYQEADGSEEIIEGTGAMLSIDH